MANILPRDVLYKFIDQHAVLQLCLAKTGLILSRSVL